MKKLLSVFLMSMIYTSLFSQIQINTINVTTNDLVYDSNTKKIYVSIPSSNGTNGNSIGIINPVTNSLENTVFIGSEPTVLAISDNGQYIYTGFSGSSTIRRFDVQTQTAGLQFSLGSSSSTGAYYAEDIEVMPGQPTTIAVSRKNNGYSPRHEGVAIYDDNIMRPTTTPNHTGSNKIEFTSANSLIGYNNETTEYGIRRLSVNNGGVTNVSVYQSILSNFYLDFIYKDNYMYSTDGKVVDVTTSPFVIGQFSNVNGPVAYDSSSNRVCFASYDYSGNIIFKRFNPSTFLLIDSLPISQAFGTVKSLITCGSGCYAFNSSDGKVVIIKDSLLSVNDPINKNFRVYPNPTSDFIFIKSKSQIKEIKILDLTGRIIKSYNKIIDNKIDLINLSVGNYQLVVEYYNGVIQSEKIIKNK